MDFSVGLNQLKEKISQQINKEVVSFSESLDRIRVDLQNFVSASGGAYKPLKSFSEKDSNPQRGKEPEGFVYAYEEIPGSSPQKKILFPLLHTFDTIGATAIEENSACAPFLFNFALRSIISYPIGDSIVYMMDSNVSGDFNSLSPICTELDDMDSQKNMFHYITSDEEKEKLLTDLISIMDKNIRNYISKYKDIRSYNKQNASMHEPYHFLFIKNIEEVFSDKKQIDKLMKLVYAHNATKAGIYIFYTYNKNKLSEQYDSYFSETYKAISSLLKISSVIEIPQRHSSNSKLILEQKATQDIVGKVINYVQTHKPPVTVMTFKEEIQQMLSAGHLWDTSSQLHGKNLSFCVGFQNAVTKKEINVFSGSSPHLFIGGKTGSGKSILLHNFILNGALRYSPEQLQFYLVDMKGGVSFVSYKNLPHVSALSASSDRHYAESLLELFYREIERRTSLFKREGASSLGRYNEAVREKGKETLPYVFGIIDEFQILFNQTDSISNKSQKYIENIHRLGRALGVFLALCTQSPPSNIDRSQVGIKMSLLCNPGDSAKLLGNEGAAKLKGVGRAIVNTSEGGEEKYNQEFQVAFIDEKKELPLYVEQIKNIYLKQHNGVDKLDHMVYDDNDMSAKMSDNPVLMNPGLQRDNRTPYIYLGVPGFYRKEHVKFCFHRDSQSNVAICGSDRPAALRLVGIIAIQFIRYYKQIGAKVFIADLQKQVEPTYNKLEFLSKKSEVKYAGATSLKEMIGEVYQILSIRKDGPASSTNEPEVLLSLVDIRPDGNFISQNTSMFNFSGTDEKTPMSMLKELIVEGPNYGIHVLVYGYNYANMDFLQSQSLLNSMEIKIALRGGNSSKLLLNYGSQDIIDQYGKGFVKMPEEMGLKYTEGDGFGDPFHIYDTLGNDQLRGSVWDTLFTNLPNKQF